MNLVDGTTRSDLRDLLGDWTTAAARMTQGHLVGEESDLNAPPLDSGEAIGSAVSGLTVTIGYGPSLFDGRFGLAAKKPALLVDLPPLPNDNLDPDYVGGDLCLQACSNDPLVAFHAVRNLARLGMGVVTYNWMEFGFGRTSPTSTAEATPRNLLGFKDGTRNIKSQQTDLLDDYVRVGNEADQPWMRGGSFLVARRIQMFIENWDRDYLGDQQNVIGRAKVTGAPLSGGSEFTPPDFTARNDEGELVIPAQAHIRLASHEENDGTRILRRGYSFTDGIDPALGTLLGGLFFIAYMKNPNQFVKLQQKLGARCLERVHQAHRERDFRRATRPPPRAALGRRPSSMKHHRSARAYAQSLRHARSLASDRTVGSVFFLHPDLWIRRLAADAQFSSSVRQTLERTSLISVASWL